MDRRKITQQWLPLWGYMTLWPGVLLIGVAGSLYVGPQLGRVWVFCLVLVCLLGTVGVTAAVLSQLSVDNSQFAKSAVGAPFLWIALTFVLIPPVRGVQAILLGGAVTAIGFVSMLGYALGWRYQQWRLRTRIQ